MKNCLACGGRCKDHFGINDSIENVQIRTLITFYLHRETAPGSLISNYLCLKCVKILWNCHRIRLNAHKLNYRVISQLNPLAQTFHPAGSDKEEESTSCESDIDEPTLIPEKSSLYQGDLDESSSNSEEEFANFSSAISRTSTDITQIKPTVDTKITQNNDKDAVSDLFFIRFGVE